MIDKRHSSSAQITQLRKNQTNIRSIATMATGPVYDELVLLLCSIAIFHPNIPIFILTQSIVKKKLEQETGLPANITFILGLEKYGNRSWKAMSVPETIEFLSQKSIILEHALEYYSNSLFMDADITIASPLGLVDDSKDLGLSPSHPKNAAKFGKYNGGWIFVNNKKFPQWWKKQMTQGSSPFIEQFCLEDAYKYFSVFHFYLNYNFNLYTRLSNYVGKSRRPFHHLLRINSDTNKGITYKDMPLISLHSRFDVPNMPWYHFIMMHLYKGSPELFKLIQARKNYPLSGPFLVNNETYVLAIQVNEMTVTAIARKIDFLHSYQTKSTRIRKFSYRLIRKIITTTLYPYYLINEGIYFYHATNRLNNRKLSCRTLIKILGQAYYYFIKTRFQSLLQRLRIRTANQ